MRANLDFFIGLRNKVEHRFVRDHAALAAAVSGQAQAMLLNYEKELTDQFGIASSLATRLRFPVFVGSFTGEGEKALLQLRKRLPASLRKFLAEYHTKLGSAVTDVIQELAPKDPDALAIQFSRLRRGPRTWQRRPRRCVPLLAKVIFNSWRPPPATPANRPAAGRKKW